MPKMKISLQMRMSELQHELAVQEGKWQKEWDNILCPFEKVNMYCSDKKRAERKKFYDRWNSSWEILNKLIKKEKT